MTPDEMREEAVQTFEKGYHRSQAVLAVGQEKLGRGNEELIRAVGAYGGGLGAGEICGAVSGALAVLGSRFRRGKDEEKEDLRMWVLVREFLKRFREDIGQGKIYCRDIAGVDWSDVSALKAFYKSEKLLVCRDLTGATERLLGEFMESGQFLKQQRK
jgi:C_GCAxxG_C_C family probable redox protein